jgi:methylmalonyl-CoA mutase N-terminal domain/subunit
MKKDLKAHSKTERKLRFTNLSGMEIKALYTPQDLTEMNYSKDLGFPGDFPFTRGIYSTLYRGRLWTMRQFSGFGTAEETNKRYRYLMKEGVTGLSVAFDMPTLMGYDSDHPKSLGEVGRCGVAVDTLEDMEILFSGISLNQVTTSMTINAPSAILLAMYVAAGEKQGVSPKKIRGTLQNDILKEYIAQKEWICPPRPSLKIINDIIKYCVQEAPQFHPVSISGYHIREAGSTAVQELAFTLYDGLTYVQSAIEYGLKVDSFAPRLSFFFNAHNNFFEEIAKYRAARRLWAREMKKRFQPQNPESLIMRFHTQTAGCSLTAQQPHNNIIRVTLQALAAVLGGTQSLHTNSMDETLALPTEEAVKIALRTQQIIAHETGIPDTVDPLGGSYYVETLTNQMEQEASKYFKRLDEMGGMVAAIEQGFPQREIHRSAVEYQHQIDLGEQTIVGVNQFLDEKEKRIPVLKITLETERRQVSRLRKLKTRRNQKKVRAALERLSAAAQQQAPLMPFILEAVKAYATLGEISDLFRQVYGEYREGTAF